MQSRQKPEPVSVSALREFAVQLDGAAGELRTVAARARLLDRRARELREEAQHWEARLQRARAFGDDELMVAAARMAGRTQGQFQAAEAELTDCLDAEAALRAGLSEERRRFHRMLEQARGIGLDVSDCLLHIDLTAPPPDDLDLDEDEEREFVARVIDGLHVH